MKDHLHIHYDQEADFIEIRVGKPSRGYFNDLGDDIFERIDEKTKKIKGYAIFNFKKRTEELKDIDVMLPSKITIVH